MKKNLCPITGQPCIDQCGAANDSTHSSGMMDAIEYPLTIFFVIRRLNELAEQLRQNTAMLASLVQSDKPAAQAEAQLHGIQMATLAEIARLQTAIIELPAAEARDLFLGEFPLMAGEGEDLLPEEPLLLLLLVQGAEMEIEDSGVESGPGRRKNIANFTRRRPETVRAADCPSKARTNRGAASNRWPKHRVSGGGLLQAN